MRKTDMQIRLKSTFLAIALAALPLTAGAAGLGKITVLSALGQPLKAELEVTATKEETQSIQAKVASVDAFRQAGVEYAGILGTLRFSRDVKERDGRRFIELTTDRPLNEPFVDMLVELSWASGRLVREYTFLLDPPELMAKPAPTPAAPPVVAVPEVKSEPATRPAAPVPAPAVVSESAAAPAKPLAAKPAVAPSSKPAESTSHKVVSGETLGKIASQTKAEGVSLDQMLVALFRSNSEAFDGGNMNRLKAGKILSVPDAEAATKISPEDAHKQILAQAADFNAYRKKLAEAASAEPAKEQTAKQAASGKIAPKVEEKAPPVAAGKDKLEVSRTEAGKDAKGKALQGRVANLEEDLVARDKALKEANSRVADLEKNLNELKKLAELKSKAGAELEKQAQAAKAAAPVAQPPAAAPVAAKPVEPPKPVEVAKPAEPPKVAVPAEPAAPAIMADAAKPADAAAPVAPPPPKKKVLPPPPPPEPEPSFIEENLPLVAGGGGVLTLLLTWLGLSAYRKKRATKDEGGISEGDLSAHSVFSTTTIAPPPSEQEPSQFSATASGMAAVHDVIDPVAEADTFLAFGRDAQAEEILLEAMKSDPQRLAIPLKLLEIYSARKSSSQFGGVARQVHEVTGGHGAEWVKVAAMGSALDSANSLYATAAPVEEAPVEQPAEIGTDFGATMILSAPAAAVEVAPVVAEEAPVEVNDTAVLDFDLDLGVADETPAVEAAPSPSSNEVAALDFDLDLGSSSESAEPQAATAEAAKEPVRDTSNEVAALDFDFDLPTPAAAPEADAPLGLDLSEPDEVSASEPAALDLPTPEAPALDANSIDFEFDLGEPVATPAAETSAPLDMALDIELPAELTAAAAPMASGIDLASISLDLDTPASDAAVSPAPTFETPAAPSEPDNPEVATKLELAMAYEEMGDRDGARELYQEALNEGSPAQQEAARAKLDSLA